MRELWHGYTNNTLGDGTTVSKEYEGPDARARLERERSLLELLHGRIPVPAIRSAEPRRLRLEFLPGRPGQELLAEGHAAEVLASCGRMLRRIHSIDPTGIPGPGPVLVHGDFGPNNVLLDPDGFAVTGVVDWEFARRGEPIVDLAWCEWIVRFHHPDCRGELRRLYAEYGIQVPAWARRRDAMLDACRGLEEFCHRWEPGGGGQRQWRRRTEITASWSDGLLWRDNRSSNWCSGHIRMVWYSAVRALSRIPVRAVKSV